MDSLVTLAATEGKIPASKPRHEYALARVRGSGLILLGVRGSGDPPGVSRVRHLEIIGPVLLSPDVGRADDLARAFGVPVQASDSRLSTSEWLSPFTGAHGQQDWIERLADCGMVGGPPPVAFAYGPAAMSRETRMSVASDGVWPRVNPRRKRVTGMTSMMTEVFELTDVEARNAARDALARGGYTFAQLADQADRNRFENLHARLTWEAVRYVGDPDRH